jgi:hypothetical protein
MLGEPMRILRQTPEVVELVHEGSCFSVTAAQWERMKALAGRSTLSMLDIVKQLRLGNIGIPELGIELELTRLENCFPPPEKMPPFPEVMGPQSCEVCRYSGFDRISFYRNVIVRDRPVRVLVEGYFSQCTRCRQLYEYRDTAWVELSQLEVDNLKLTCET